MRLPGSVLLNALSACLQVVVPESIRKNAFVYLFSEWVKYQGGEMYLSQQKFK